MTQKILQQKALMEQAIDTIKKIQFTQDSLFGFTEDYKRAKIEKLYEYYADLMVSLFKSTLNENIQQHLEDVDSL